MPKNQHWFDWKSAYIFCAGLLLYNLSNAETAYKSVNCVLTSLSDNEQREVNVSWNENDHSFIRVDGHRVPRVDGNSEYTLDFKSMLIKWCHIWTVNSKSLIGCWTINRSTGDIKKTSMKTWGTTDEKLRATGTCAPSSTPRKF